MKRLRHGFTLIELLIVIAIIGILIASIAVAVTKAKEYALRMACGNNMRNITTAYKVHEAEKGYFPTAAHSSQTGFQYTSPPTRGPFQELLPYMEQKHIHAMFKKDTGWFGKFLDDPVHKDAYGAFIPIFACPGFDSKPRYDTDPELKSSGQPWITKFPRGACDFSPAEGLSPSFAKNTNTPTADVGYADDEPGGFLERKKKQQVKATSITDGPANTILLLECAGRPTFYENGKPVPGKGKVDGGSNWASHRNGFSVHGRDPKNPSKAGPCFMNCTNDNEIYAFHSGGANCGFGDGAVRFIAQSVSAETFSRLISRDKGVPPAGDW